MTSRNHWLFLLGRGAEAFPSSISMYSGAEGVLSGAVWNPSGPTEVLYLSSNTQTRRMLQCPQIMGSG